MMRSLVRRAALVVAAGCILHAVAGCSGSRTEGLDTSKLPTNVRDDYAIFARRCSKCHSLARPLSAGITDDDQWVRYVNRMRRQPGSGISQDDQERILRFLRYYAADLRQKDAEKRGLAPSPSSSTTTSPAPDPSTAPTPASSPSSGVPASKSDRVSKGAG